MATWKFEGMDEYLAQMKKLYDLSEVHAKRVLYKGAGVAADIVKAAVNEIPVDDDKGTKDMRRGLRKIQKEGLVQSFGITSMRPNGTGFDVKLGFDGYNKLQTKSWPNGQPNAMIARSIESGNSFTPATHFMSKATKKAKLATEMAMKVALDTEIKKIVK